MTRGDVDRQKRFRQSAVIPYRRQGRGGELEVLLITSIRRGAWIVPKGMVEPDLTEAESAAKEAREEAGVLGRVGREPVGSYTYEKWGGTCEVTVFDLEVQRELGDWPERDVRRRRWARTDDAVEAVENDRLKRMIAGLPARLGCR
jgi:phosphohistidine phosphatase